MKNDDPGLVLARRARCPERQAFVAADRGVGPLDVQHHERAAAVAIDRSTHHLTADQPDWLHHLLGARPEAPMAATVWDDATRTIAAHRTRQQVPPDAEGLGPPPLVDTPEHDAWSRASTHLARTRIWLASHANGPTVPLTRNRSAAELGTRGEQLERIFAAAPPDQSRLIESLTTGQLTLDDAARALDQALATQGARRDWVLEHWPHIVEHAEITRSLTAHAAAPDLGGLLDQLASSGTAAGDDTSAAALVTAAARAGEPWLQGLLGNLVPAGTTHVDDATSELLGRVAVYRHRWRVSHRDPLGPAASTANQATERAVLEADLVAAAVDRSGRHVPAEPQRAGHEVDRPVGATRDDLRTDHGLGI